MDKKESHELSKSSTIVESTPLLNKKEPVDLYSNETKSEKPASDSNNGSTLVSAGASSMLETTTAHISEEDTAELEEDTSEKLEESGEKVAEHIGSYEGIADILAPSFGCGLVYGIWLCLCHFLTSFVIQLPLHLLLLSLPISVGFMGAKYMTQCPMNSSLPYAVMVVGFVGSLVLLVRLALLLHTKFSTDERLKKWLRTATKLLETVFLVSLIVEIYFSHLKSPSEDPLSPNYCEKTFYNFVISMNDVWIALVVVWIFLYCITRRRCMQRAAPI